MECATGSVGTARAILTNPVVSIAMHTSGRFESRPTYDDLCTVHADRAHARTPDCGKRPPGTEGQRGVRLATVERGTSPRCSSRATTAAAAATASAISAT